MAYVTIRMIAIRMKQFLLLSTILLSAGADQRPPTLVRTLDVEAGETYVQIWPADGFLYIKEYHVSTLKSNDVEIHRQVAHISDLVRSANYSKARYGLRVFTPMEERIFRDRQFVTVECRLLTKERNLQTLMDNAFSSLLGRQAKTRVFEDEIGLYFNGPDIEVRNNNAKGVFAKDGRRAIFWRNGERFYEAVFAQAGTAEKDFKSIAAYLERDVASPEKSEAEIKAWKEAK
jgi:hypothetical protein